MKKILFICAVVVSFIGFTSMVFQNNAEFKFEEETHDFGKIPQGTPVTFEFKFKNIGTEPLIISKVESTCGCTVPKYTNTPIKPNEDGSVSVTYNAASAHPFSKMVTIKSNAKTPVKVLYIKGTVEK